MQTYWNAKALNNKRLKLPCLSAALLYSNCSFTTLVAWGTNISWSFYGGNLKKCSHFQKLIFMGFFIICFDCNFKKTKVTKSHRYIIYLVRKMPKIKEN